MPTSSHDRGVTKQTVNYFRPVLKGAIFPILLRSPATVKGFIGGESHDSYVIRVRKGQVMTVQVSWKREGDNHASFTVSESPNFFTGEPSKFGKESDDGMRWMGKSPKTSEYYIYVVAHPTAQYILKVKVT